MGGLRLLADLHRRRRPQLLIGGFSKAFLAGITPSSTVETFSKGVVIPEFVYIFFQGTFAAITPALIVGAFAERIKFSALLLFIALWATFIYSRWPTWCGSGAARAPTPIRPA